MARPSDAEILLVSYVNGTATREQAARVEAALRQDPALVAEWRYLRALRRAARTPIDDTPVELGLERLRSDIARHTHEHRSLWFWRCLAILAAALLVAISVVHLREYFDGDDPVPVAAGHDAKHAAAALPAGRYANGNPGPPSRARDRNALNARARIEPRAHRSRLTP